MFKERRSRIKKNLQGFKASFKNSRTFRQTLLILFCIPFVLVMFFQFVLYRSAYQNMLKDKENSKQSIMTLASTQSDSEFSVLAGSADALAWKSSLLESLVFPGRITPDKSFQIVQALKDYIHATDFITDATLYSRTGNTVYSSSGDVVKLTGPYAPGGSPIGYSWQLKDSKFSACELCCMEGGGLCLLLHCIPNSDGYLGSLVLSIDEEALFSYVCGDDTEMMVFSPDNELLYAAKDAAEGPETLEEDHISADCGLLFYRQEPTNSPKWVYSFNQNMQPLFIVSLIMVILLAGVGTYLVYNPMRKLLSSVQSSTTQVNYQGNDWAFLFATLKLLSDKSTQSDYSLNKLLSHFQKAYLINLIEDRHDAEIEKLFNSTPNVMPQQGNFVLFITYNRISGVLSQSEIEHTIQRLSNLPPACGNAFSFEYRCSLLTLINISVTDEDGLDDRIAELNNMISVYTQNLPNRFLRSSRLFHHLSALQPIYQQVISECVSVNGSSLSKDDLIQQINISIGSLVDRNEESGTVIVDYLLSGIKASELSPKDKYDCYTHILKSLSSFGEKYGLRQFSEIIPSFDSSLDGMAAYVEKESLRMLHEIYSRINYRQYGYFVAANNYIENHYMECNLSLTAIASELGISASYLSRIFTATCGKRFTQVLNDLRISKAKELLADKDVLIRRIAEDVGFLTVQNFMRVFKQSTGITPSEYRMSILYQQPPQDGGAEQAEQ